MIDIKKEDMNVEKVFQGSFGIDPVLLHFRDTFSKPNNKINSILISVNTCIRNVTEKDLTEKEILARLMNEFNQIIEVITDSLLDKNFYIGFFITNHLKDYPNDKMRPVTEGKKLYYKICDYVWNNFDTIEFDSDGSKPYVEFFKLTNKNYGQLLYERLTKLNRRLPSYVYTGYFYLLSHQPLDFYVLLKAPNSRLISSHTAEVLSSYQLGKKVFDSEFIPFIFIIHILLGDKVQVLPTISIKKRKQLKEQAEKDKWYLKTANQIKDEIRRIGIIVT